MIVVNVRKEGGVSVRARSRVKYVIDTLNNHPICRENKISFTTDIPGYFDHHLAVDTTNPFLNINNAEADLTEFKLGSRIVTGVVESEIAEAELEIVGNIFFHLSRYEELSLKQTDYLGDKMAFESQLLLVKRGMEKVAVVDELIRAYVETLTKKEIKIPKKQTLTHDIDFIQKFSSPLSIVRKVAGHIRHRKSVKGFPILWKSYMAYLLKGKDGFDTFKWMLSETKMDKTIYFLMGGDHKEDNEYSLTNPIFLNALALAKERGYRVGIHPSYESWNDLELVKKQKERLESVVGGEIVRSRQHFLNFCVEKTPRILQSLGIKEDSSLGYTRYVGYRCGTGFPFKLYDFKNEKSFDVVENPLVFMDSAWLYESLRTKIEDFSFLENCNGAVNFHNSMFDEMAHRNIDLKEIYQSYYCR